ncbi:uncharacterized protein NPIL_240351 [Nephila pilipes]|uniref:Mutator-like transposase domain-containing protein n=1 Tax=Nephila pilipes TaxID=299642 RepID=A0A8X6IJX8_NEPPI|nr:uncharacterized protein NPIL_240351 [Nephila pilipes]
MFSGIMNLPPLPTKFNNILLQAAREICEERTAEAVYVAVEENDGGRDIAVAVDGSWQKRGFSSKNGVVTVTSVDTGKVIDVDILSKHCICPNKIKHLQNCKRNFDGYSVNNRLVYALRCIGKGAESAVMFCGIMNLPPPPTKFTKFNNNLLQAARETCEESMAEAVHEAVEENEGGRDIAVAVDGSWQKRGFSSKNGVVTVTSVDTGKVIDVEILSKHCICPNKTKHLQNCKRNFVGYSGKMELYNGERETWRRKCLEDKYGLRNLLDGWEIEWEKRAAQFLTLHR